MPVLRSLLRTPGFTAVAVLTLALGIGANTTVFSWVERVLLNPLPGAAEADRIVALETLTPSREIIDTSYADFRDYRSQAKTLSHVFVYKPRPLNLGTATEAQRVWSQMVSGNFFDALGVQPRLGRFFTAADRPDDPAAAAVVVLSERFWRQRFGGDPTILGRTLKLNQHEFTVIGVAPAEFPGSLNGLAFDLWIPLELQSRLTGMSPSWRETRRWRALHMLGRLAPGASLEAARAELAGIATQLAAAHPDSNRDTGIVALPITESPHGAHRLLARPLLLLLGGCALLLVIVCANLSNLLLVRATARQRELCVRQALGAGRWRLIRQLLTESLLLCAAGASVGLLLTWWLSDLLGFFIPGGTLPIALQANLSGRVLALSVGLSSAATLLAGLAPALWAARTDLMGVLRTSGRSAALTPRAELFRGGLVAAQVAIAIVTLACAGLTAKSFREAKRAHPGFDTDGVLLAVVKLDTSGYSRQRGVAFLAQLQQRLGELPAAESVAIAENVPLGLSRGSWEEIVVPGYAARREENLKIYRNLVSPGYFSLMRTSLLTGREFTTDDRPGAPFVAVVNETFARRFFGTADSVGRKFSIWEGARELTVVGVARDTKIHRLGEEPLPYYYVPLAQFFSPDTGLAVHLRTRGDPLAQLPAVRATVRELDPSVPIFEALTLDDHVSAARFAQKTAASLFGGLSVFALTLTSLGLYGVVAFAVAQRTAEIGVRLALGATARDIMRLVLQRGSKLIALGVLVGLLAAAAVARGLAGTFYGIETFEPALLLSVAALVLAPALIACWVPARRASRLDPVTALRAE